jgi:cytidylate kinase
MILVISGLHGTGKSTVARALAQGLGLTHYSTGDIFRLLAQERGMGLEEFSRYAEEHPEVDLELDERVRRIAEEAVVAGGARLVFDGQLAAYTLGTRATYCILLKCARPTRIERMMGRDGRTLEEVENETNVREQSERERFIELYNIDLLDTALIMGTYDLILDVTRLGIEEVTAIARAAIERAHPGE